MSTNKYFLIIQIISCSDFTSGNHNSMGYPHTEPTWYADGSQDLGHFNKIHIKSYKLNFINNIYLKYIIKSLKSYAFTQKGQPLQVDLFPYI